MARIDEIMARKAEIRSIINTEGAEFDVDALTAEVRDLDAEAAEIETRAAKADALRSAVSAESRAAISVKANAAKPKTEAEIRSSREYGAAYLKGIKSGDYAEARALLSTNVSGGQVPVPTMLEDAIRTAWAENDLMQLVQHSYFAGNVTIGFELSATGATVHVEGTPAPTQETITIGVVEIKAQTIKKWILVSDEAIENTTVDTVGYLYREIAHKIVEKAEETLILAIENSPAAATATAAGVPTMEVEALSATTIATAVSLLASGARDLHVVMNRQTYPAFLAVAMAANYAVDVFDGLKDRIHYSDVLKPFATAEDEDFVLIVGDFRRGAQANFPNGDNVKIIRDDLSQSEADLVKIVGKQLVGIGVVNDKHFVTVTKSVTT